MNSQPLDKHHATLPTELQELGLNYEEFFKTQKKEMQDVSIKHDKIFTNSSS